MPLPIPLRTEEGGFLLTLPLSIPNSRQWPARAKTSVVAFQDPGSLAHGGFQGTDSLSEIVLNWILFWHLCRFQPLWCLWAQSCFVVGCFQEDIGLQDEAHVPSSRFFYSLLVEEGQVFLKAHKTECESLDDSGMYMHWRFRAGRSPSCWLNVSALGRVDGPVNPSPLQQGIGKGKVAGLLSCHQLFVVPVKLLMKGPDADNGLVMSFCAQHSHRKWRSEFGFVSLGMGLWTTVLQIGSRVWALQVSGHVTVTNYWLLDSLVPCLWSKNSIL